MFNLTFFIMDNKFIKQGERIEKIRRDLGLSQSEFASKVHANSKGVVSTWETGKYLPGLKQLAIIADIGNTTIDYIITGDKEKIKESLILKELNHREMILFLEKNNVKTLSQLKRIFDRLKSADLLVNMVNQSIKDSKKNH